jgi:hypothetical protein
VRTPPLVVTYRVITVLISVAIIAAVAAGAAGHGPLAILSSYAGSTGTGR